jgi:hypothetical protein
MRIGNSTMAIPEVLHHAHLPYSASYFSSVANGAQGRRTDKVLDQTNTVILTSDL